MIGTDVAARVFPGESVMAKRCRDFDWSATPLGPIELWPSSLVTIASTLIASRHPMFLWWGPSLVQIFNDGYLPSFGSSGRGTNALGASGPEHWSDIWHIIGPRVLAVMSVGIATWNVDELIPIERNGRLEHVWWTYGYSPVRDDTGAIAGVLVVVQETTSRVLALESAENARELNARLYEFSSAIAVATTPDELADAVLTHTAPIFGASGVVVATMAQSRDSLELIRISPVPDLVREEWATIPLDARVPLADAARAKQPVFLESREEWEAHYPGMLPLLEATGHHANAVIPLIVDDNVLGVIGIAFDAPCTFTDHLRAIALSVGAQCAQTLDRARLYAAERDARHEAENANRAKSEFLAVMSHELRTPLNAIAGYAELMEMELHGPMTSDQLNAVARIKRSERHLLRLINEVLNFSRLEAGAVHYDITSFRALDVLSGCEELVAPQAREKSLTLSFVPSDPELFIYADREKVEQIVLNLVSNSIKFTEPGGIITVMCEGIDKVVAIDVVDTGIGIPANQLGRIFSPFVQVDAGLTRTQHGTGLGLAISRDLARRMGGDVIAESAFGVGSTFRVTLPRA